MRTFAVFMLLTLLLPFGLAAYISEDAFLEHAVREHALNEDYWGKDEAEAIKRVAIRIYVAVIPSPPEPPSSIQSDSPGQKLARQVSAAFERVAATPYTRSIDGAIFLFCFRTAALLHWLPPLFVLLLLNLLDGDTLRRIKTKEFVIHSSPLHGTFSYAVSSGVGLLLFSFCWPITMHPATIGVVGIAIAVCVQIAMSNYHQSA